MIAFERRASVVLFNLLRARADPRPFLLPGNVCPIVPETFEAAGQPFDLVDIAEPWLEMDAEQCLERLRAQEFGGIVFVRPYGSERDPSPFFSELRAVQHDLLIIDDQCLCRPDCDGASLSQFADATLFSTGHAKFTDLDGGGFAHLRDGVAYQHAGDGPETSWLGYRTRALDATRAAIIHKTALNAIYSEAIPGRVQLPAELQNWRFNIRVPDSERLVAELFANDLFASRHYPPLGDFHVAATLHSDIVNLFNDRYFTEEQARRAAELVNRHLK